MFLLLIRFVMFYISFFSYVAGPRVFVVVHGVLDPAIKIFLRKEFLEFSSVRYLSNFFPALSFPKYRVLREGKGGDEWLMC